MDTTVNFFPFLELPGEIREEIYHYLLMRSIDRFNFANKHMSFVRSYEERPIQVLVRPNACIRDCMSWIDSRAFHTRQSHRSTLVFDSSSRAEVQIFRLNKQIYREALAFFYSRNTFTLNHPRFDPFCGGLCKILAFRRFAYTRGIEFLRYLHIGGVDQSLFERGSRGLLQSSTLLDGVLSVLERAPRLRRVDGLYFRSYTMSAALGGPEWVVNSVKNFGSTMMEMKLPCHPTLRRGFISRDNGWGPLSVKLLASGEDAGTNYEVWFEIETQVVKEP
ncbi:MAG: hypothetical protein Q9227_000101 [Pyrenula ochraceoflavens]